MSPQNYKMSAQMKSLSSKMLLKGNNYRYSEVVDQDIDLNPFLTEWGRSQWGCFGFHRLVSHHLQATSAGKAASALACVPDVAAHADAACSTPACALWTQAADTNKPRAKHGDKYLVCISRSTAVWLPFCNCRSIWYSVYWNTGTFLSVLWRPPTLQEHAC